MVVGEIEIGREVKREVRNLVVDEANKIVGGGVCVQLVVK